MYPRLPGIADAAILRELQGMNASHDFIFAFGHRARCERRGEKRPKMPMHRWLVAALLICIAATSLGCRSMMIFMARRISEPAATSPPVDIAVERDIVFAETPDGPLALDVYTLVDRPAAPLPVIVFVHGGGWFAGNKNQIQLGRGFELTRRGYAVVAVSHRLTDVAVFPAQIHDSLRAFLDGMFACPSFARRIEEDLTSLSGLSTLGA